MLTKLQLILLTMRVVLPSNASMKHYPSNTLASFTVELPQPIDLSAGEWEIGLSEIQFLKSWYNVQNGKIILQSNGRKALITIPAGYYHNGEDLFTTINRVLSMKSYEITNRVAFVYNKASRTCDIEIKGSEGLSIEMSRDLELALGYKCRIKNITNAAMYSTRIGSRRVNIVIGPNTHRCRYKKEADHLTIFGMYPIRLVSIYNLMVYTNIAQGGIVGDVEAPLLRVVPVEHEHWTYQCTQFNSIQYLPLSQKHIRSISIYIYSDYGELVPFTDGKTIVTLDIRRSNSLLSSY